MKHQTQSARSILAALPLFYFLITPVSCSFLFKDPVEEAAKTVPAEIVHQMTLEEKVGKLIHIGIAGKQASPAAKADIERYHVGGVILFEVNLGPAPEIEKLTEGLQAFAKGSSPNPVPLFISIDQEGGRVVRVKDGVDQLPGAAAMGQTENEQIAEDAGFETAHQLANLGINLLLAPDVDVNNNPANPVINIRSFSGDPQTVAKVALAFARGVRDAGAIPVLKHFPGHGNTNTDSHTALPTIKSDLAHMEQIEIVPFKAGIDQGNPAIMSAHILFPALDPKEPATLSQKILKDYLRTKLGFKGVVITDALEMKAVADRYPAGQVGRKAFEAGADILLLTSTGERMRLIYETMVAGFKSGELSVAALDEAVLRQIELKFRSGLFQRYGMTRANWDKDLAPAFEKRTQKAKERFTELSQKYPAGLNATLSRDSISSLRKPFGGILADQKSGLRLIHRSPGMLAEAKALGLDQTAIIYSASPVNTAAMMFVSCPVGQGAGSQNATGNAAAQKCPEILAVELSDYDLWRWNLLVEESRIAAQQKRPSPTLVGLYTGNPYLRILVPEKGAVLCSFSPTDESVKAIVHRLLENSPIRQAKLVLADDK